ncbi:proline iminopeptidase [Chitinivorax tropicus]|uniref:Proline iminopeptidase n=1 Tax=Chitinivorax tropicus TaxID=714531 RepID=A0A840MHP7_9PROT|nr:prolyl aminopeptidase [Chitinivorax tropicus]MBB5017045.1 proline iminopeptidase [Chitinivorax tropicus]
MRTQLYPPIAPFNQGMLKLDDIHTMYFEESGNPQGVPVVFLHGGPGAGSSPKHRQFFDPAFYRIVVFDQRGAGRSTPLGELKDNTTGHLVADIEALRRHLGIDKWLVFGGSWGSTLSLAYAEAHPERVLGLVLRGIFLCRDSEIDWFMHGIRNIFPDHWKTFSEFLPAEERSDLLTNYYRRLTDPDPAIHMPAARVWSHYEGACCTLLPDESLLSSHFDDDNVALGLARIEAHYFMNKIFQPDNHLLDSIGRIRHLPAVIVQGRYDIVCPPITAWDLHQAWPEAEYIVVHDAGHAAWEPGICSELVKACERFKETLA